MRIAVTTIFSAVLATVPIGAFASNAVLTSSAGALEPGTQLVAQATGDMTFTASGVGVTCSASDIDATVLTDPAAPGTATLSVTGFSFSGCTSDIEGTTGVGNVSFDNLPYTLSIDDARSPATATLRPGDGGPIQLDMILHTASRPEPCFYQPGGSSMSADVTAGGLTFDVALDATGPHGIITDPCLHAGHMHAPYGPLLVLNSLQPIGVN